MILKQRRLFFRTILLILEDEMITSVINDGAYSKISITSYKKMDLPGFEELIKTTALIDLTPDEGSIFSKFSDTTRNEIRKTERNTELMVVADDDNFDGAYRLYKDFEYAQGRVPVTQEALRECKLFCAYFRNELISAIFVMESPHYLRIRSIFSKRLTIEDKETYKLISNATRRLVWEICRWGKGRGFVSLDLASVNFNNPKTANITKFKMSFGGGVVNEYTYVYRSKTFLFFERLVTFKILATRLLRKIKSATHLI